MVTVAHSLRVPRRVGGLCCLHLSHGSSGYGVFASDYDDTDRATGRSADTDHG